MSTKKRSRPVTDEYIVVCSYCSRLLKGRKFWKKEILNVGEVNLPPVSHGICNDCLLENFPDEYQLIPQQE